MEELRQTAEAYYNGGCKSLKQSADEFFKSMDSNGDGQIRLHEYLAYMREEGFTYLSSRDTFFQLKKKEVDYLEFPDVLTLFYIINSGRPQCDGCGTLITGLFFTCPTCFDDASNTFDVCPNCYHHGDYVHDKHTDQFLDNFTLLRLNRRASLAAKSNKPQPQPQPQSTVQIMRTTPSIVPITGYYTPDSSLQLVLATPQIPKKSKWKGTLKAIGSGFANGFIASGGCSIM